MNFFQEFKKRRIGQTLVIYLGGAWVALEALSFFIEQYNWPPSLIDYAVATLAFGLVGSLIHAWFHGEKGIQAYTKPELFLQLGNFVLAIFVLFSIYNGQEPLQLDKAPKSVAVLPFENLNRDEENDFISDGITEDIISRLSQVEDVKVISRTSSFF